MNRKFHEALLIYLDHCESHQLFVAHPLGESSQMIDGDWHLQDGDKLIAIVTKKGNVGCVCTQHPGAPRRQESLIPQWDVFCGT